MNPRLIAIVIAIIGLMMENLSWGQGEAQAIMVLKRARNVANQNNERQGLPPQYPSGQPAPATPPAVPQLTPEQMALGRLSTAIASIKSPVTTEQKDELSSALRANIRGAIKPSSGSIAKLTGNLSAALAAGKPLSAAQRGRVLQDILAVFNNTSLPTAQLNDTVADIPAILKKAGAGETEAAAVGEDFKAIATEIRKKA